MKALPTWLVCYAALMSIVLLAPILVVVLAAFTSSNFVTFPPQGVSLRWFEKVLREPEFVVPLWNSLRIGITATIVSIVLVVPAALVFVRGYLPGRRLVETFLLAPLSMPPIILAIGLLFFAARIGLSSSFLTLVFGHVVITSPYIFRTVVSVYSSANPELTHAAQTLGANRWWTFWYVTLPEIRPGILAGAIFSFLISFDEVAIALLVSDSETTTLPASILSYLVYNYDPAVAAISAIQVLLVMGLLLILERVFGIRNAMFGLR